MQIPQSRFYAVAITTVVSIVAIMFFIDAYMFGSRAGGANASIDLTSTVAMQTGSTVDLPVTISSDGADLLGADIVLQFDPTALQIVTLQPQSLITSVFTLLPQDSNGNFDSAQAIAAANSSGVLQVGAVSLNGQSFQGSGIVGVVTFRSLKDGTSSVNVDFTPGATGDSNLIVAPGVDTLARVTNATVTSTSAPGPTDTPAPGATDTPTPPPGATSTPTPPPVVVTDPPTPSPDATNTPTPTSGPTATPAPTNTPAPTSTPAPTGVNLSLKLHFQGIESPSSASSLNVTVTLAGGSLTSPVTQIVPVVSGTNGIYTGIAPFANVQAGNGFRVYVKGPKHLQKKVCDLVPTERTPGTYHCVNGSITLSTGNNNLDLSGIRLLAGDLPDTSGVQNGLIDRNDVSLIVLKLGSTVPAELAQGDLNYDGIINTQDYSLVLEALSVRFDEE